MTCVFVPSAGAASFTAPPQLFVDCHSFPCSYMLPWSSLSTWGTKQSVYHLLHTWETFSLEARFIPLLWDTCERTCRLGWIVARLEVGLVVLYYLHVEGVYML